MIPHENPPFLGVFSPGRPVDFAGRRFSPSGLIGHCLRDRGPGGLQGGRGQGQAHCHGAHHEGISFGENVDDFEVTWIDGYIYIYIYGCMISDLS